MNPARIQNNNPLNLRYHYKVHWRGQLGSRRGFCIFDTLAHGYRAAFLNMKTHYRRGEWRRLVQLIQLWAPAQDGNNPLSYAQHVGLAVGINPWALLPSPDKDRQLYCRIAAAMTVIEKGIPADRVDRAAILLGYDEAFGAEATWK